MLEITQSLPSKVNPVPQGLLRPFVVTREEIRMGSLPSWVGYWPWVVLVIVFVVCYKWTFWLLGIAVIPEDCIGVINKKFVLWGENKSLPDGKIIALKGEAGFQADTLAPGLYFGYWPWQYSILRTKFTTVEDGMIGIVETRDGSPLTNGRVLGKKVDCDAIPGKKDLDRFANS